MAGVKQGPHHLAKVLEDILDRSGFRRKIQEQKVMDIWEKAVGEAIAEMTQPIRIKDRVLQVKVCNSVWMQQLLFYKKLIIQKLNEAVGDGIVEDLRFFIGEKEKEPADGFDRVETKGKNWKFTRRLSPSEMERVERETQGIRDAEIREVLARVFAKGLMAKKEPREGDKKEERAPSPRRRTNR